MSVTGVKVQSCFSRPNRTLSSGGAMTFEILVNVTTLVMAAVQDGLSGAKAPTPGPESKSSIMTGIQI